MLEQTNTTPVVGEQSPTYHPLNPVQCISVSSNKQRKKNMRYSMSKTANVKRLELLHYVERFSNKISIVGGGPSLNETYKNIKGDIMVCGSAHDHALKLGIKPTYAIECDPDVRQVQYYNENSPGCKYLIASRCDRSMFKHLKDRDVYLWHMFEQDLGKPAYKGEPGYNCGATVFLAAIPVALTLGYRLFEFYGIDSSFQSKEQHHAYQNVEETAQILTVRVGDPLKGREFQTTATWVGQAQQYQDMVKHWPVFKGTFHGDGMLAEMERQAGRQ